jgi:hypothetical protein
MPNEVDILRDVTRRLGEAGIESFGRRILTLIFNFAT